MGFGTFFKNKFTLQTNENAGQDTDGAVNRDSGYQNVTGFINIKCSLQGINSFDIANIIGKIDEEITNVIYHNNKSLVVSANNRILMATDPTQKITDFNNASGIRIFTFKGQRNSVAHKDTGKPFEIFVEENNRENL